MKSVITISINQKLLSKLDNEIKSYKYANRSHGFEYLVAKEIIKTKENIK
tara:strand:+ start:73 stop:222 length:150 start_codon:yes stop_codon:yes gene_type:complete